MIRYLADGRPAPKVVRGHNAPPVQRGVSQCLGRYRNVIGRGTSRRW